MKQKRLKWSTLFFLFIGFLSACTALDLEAPSSSVTEGERYYAAEEVAEYVHLYEELPPNYLTKNEARDMGWLPAEGNLWEVTDEMVIGGDYFGNFEGLLPENPDRDYYEADVNYVGGHRNAERIVFSDDGLIFYTDDHYETFEQWYGEEE